MAIVFAPSKGCDRRLVYIQDVEMSPCVGGWTPSLAWRRFRSESSIVLLNQVSRLDVGGVGFNHSSV
jgi:hypothetical protein